MRILCVIDSLGSGGAQRQMVELAKGFKERGHEVEFLIYHNLTFYSPILTKENIKINLIPSVNAWRRFLKIRNFIRSSEPDIVLSFLQIPNLFAVFSSIPFRSWKLIVGERSADPQILRSCKRKFLRFFYIFTDYVIANSFANIKMVRKINPLLNESKCRVIYNIIDNKLWVEDQNYYPLKSGKLHLSIAASHRYLKNAKGLVEAIHLLDPVLKRKLIVSWYGRKDEDESYIEVKALTERYGLNNVIKFYDPTTNIPSIFANSDVIGLFSFHEGLPNTICEALTLGKPVIASNISDVPILLGSNRNVLFDPKNVNEIVKSLTYMLNLTTFELQQIGRENRIRAEKLLDSNNIIESYLSCFKK